MNLLALDPYWADSDDPPVPTRQNRVRSVSRVMRDALRGMDPEQKDELPGHEYINENSPPRRPSPDHVAVARELERMGWIPDQRMNGKGRCRGTTRQRTRCSNGAIYGGDYCACHKEEDWENVPNQRS